MQVHVRTTQNVFIHYPVASVGDRILAYLLDLIIRIAYAIGLTFLLADLNVNAIWVWIVLLGVPILMYHLFFEIFMDGQSPGKRALTIKVMRLDGTPASVGDYILRWIFSFVDYYIFSGLIAVLTIVIGQRGQRLGDLAAGTTVIKLVHEDEVKSEQIFVQQELDHKPVFPQVVELNEQDIELIRQALEVSRDGANVVPVIAITEKLKMRLRIETDLPPVKFLYTLIRDFQHYATR
ncbi:MAG TPA: RDD family protein [Cyclobacteriaceae bacterium]|nr:RDD family protein [Cyclobacteriaceae bacterium]